MLVLSRYVVVSDPVNGDNSAMYRIVVSTQSMKVLIVPGTLWQLVEDSQIDLLPDATKQELHAALVLVDDGQDELAGVLKRNRDAIATSRSLYECVQPSAACQLGCDYCGQKHESTLLSERNQSMLVERVSRRLSSGRYSELQVGWFGGEPLIGLGVIRKLTEAFREVASKNQCVYGAKIVTNGLALSHQVARELVLDLAVHEIEVTLDGPPEFHNARRCTKGGLPTFERIFANLVAAASDGTLPVRLVVRCNVDRRNAAHIPEFIKILAETPLSHRATVYFAPIHDWGNDAHSLALPREEYAQLEVDWLAQLVRRGFGVKLLPQAKPIVCMAVNPHAELTDPHGEVFNCTEVSLVPAYGVPNLYTIGLPSGPVASSAAHGLSEFLNDIEQGKYDCDSCRMLPVCGGACPKEWRDGGEPCPSTKWNIKERLVLAWALARQGPNSSGYFLENV